MQTYLTLVSIISLAGFYTAAVILSRAIPTFALGVDDSAAIRGTLAMALGVAVAAFPLWRMHWMSLRRLWAERLDEGRQYLLLVSSLGVAATAISAGRLVTNLATLLLSAAPASRAGWANLLSALLLFLVSWLLWRHHWKLLRREAAASPPAHRIRRRTNAVSLPDRERQAA